MMKIINIGMNHETAPLELRECLATDPDNAFKALVSMRDLECIREGLYLSTCNRVELYAVSRDETPATLRIAARDETDKVVVNDQFRLVVFPRISSASRVNSRWRIFDPVGKTTDELKRLGLRVEPLAPGDDLREVDVLVVGYKAFSRAKRLPFTLDDLACGS